MMSAIPPAITSALSAANARHKRPPQTLADVGSYLV